MKIVLAAILTLAVFAAFHFPILRKNKQFILAVYSVGMIVLFVYYNARTLKRIIPFYHPSQQTLYQLECLENGDYTDAFLDLFLKEKTVYTPDDSYNISLEDPISPRLYAYYHAYNMWNYLESNDVDIVKEPSLNSYILSDTQRSHFNDLGYANDLMRYTFPYTKYADKFGNGYFHYWYYSTYINTSHIYICDEDLDNTNDLVMLWETDNDGVTENYYIASKEWFKSLSALPQQQSVCE